MTKTALFIRHQAKPGQRDEVRRVWEKFVKPRATANPAHEAYYFCYDSNDGDVICVFQLYTRNCHAGFFERRVVCRLLESSRRVRGHAAEDHAR